MNLPRPLEKGRLVRRLNRFAAEVRIGRSMVTAHVANSGRLGELLVEGAEVFLHAAGSDKRLTSHDLVLVRYGGALVSVDSRAPAAIAAEALLSGGIPPVANANSVRREVPFGGGRIDLLADAQSEEWLIEVKGCTLVVGGTAIFPDAPTARGRRHVEELAAAARDGGRGMVLFVIQRDDARELRPNWDTDPAFAEALGEAHEAGVAVAAHVCRVSTRRIMLARSVPVRLDRPPPDSEEAQGSCA